LTVLSWRHGDTAKGLNLHIFIWVVMMGLKAKLTSILFTAVFAAAGMWCVDVAFKHLGRVGESVGYMVTAMLLLMLAAATLMFAVVDP